MHSDTALVGILRAFTVVATGVVSALVALEAVREFRRFRRDEA